MEGIVVGLRGGVKTRRMNQVIVEVAGITNRYGANKLIGKTAVWKTKSGKIRKGKITRIHGNNGKVILRFPSNVSANIIGQKVVIK